MENYRSRVQNRFAISFSCNSFLWLPPKSATTLLSWIFRYYDFENYSFLNNEFIPQNYGGVHLGHIINYPPNHENLTFLLAIRNPYERLLSFFKMSHSAQSGNIEAVNKEFFNNIMDPIINDENHPFNQHVGMLERRNPDFLIRAENIFEDLSKIPFVYNSEIYKCGATEKMCQKRINFSLEQNKENFFSQEQIKKINKMYHKIFELGNYEKL